MGINVIKPGLLSTIQDAGRTGYRKEGVVVGGAMDALALKIGNLLLGNSENLAGIECTLTGPELSFETNQMICITGGDLSPKIDQSPIKMWRPVFVKKGAVLSFGAPAHGCRTYVSVHGGLDLPVVLGSRSTYLKAGFGGLKGRALRKGDYLPFSNPYMGEEVRSNWSVDLKQLYPDTEELFVRIIPGPEYDWFTERSKLELLEREFELSAAADRMGYQLTGPKLELKQPRELLSSAVAFGTLQVTSNGSPILLMADHQTTGGYPRIAQVISSDLSLLAQRKAGESLRFKLITLEEAHILLELRAKQFRKLKHTLTLKGILQ